jgi:hypothetical protein
MLVAAGRSIGRPGQYPACNECAGDENGPLEGFRAVVRGIVTDLGDGTIDNPAFLTVSSAAASNGRSDDACSSDPQATVPPGGSPVAAPGPSPESSSVEALPELGGVATTFMFVFGILYFISAQIFSLP